MADGQTHLVYWKSFMPLVWVLGIWAYFSSTNVYLVFGFISGYLLGYFIDPDLDMPNNTSAKQRWKSTIIGYPVYLWWQVYAYTIAYIFGGHRAFLNHFPGISTTVRVLWLLSPGLLYFYFYGIPEWVGIGFICIGGVILGLSIADLVHYILDIVY